MASVGQRARASSRSTSGIRLFAALWILVVGLVVVLRVWALIPHVWDLGFFVHGLSAVAREGLSAPVPFAGWTLLEDHFSPLLLLMAPLSRFSWSPYLLVVVQAGAVALSIPLAWRMAERVSHSERQTWLLTLAYALSPVLLFAVFFDIHASVLAAPLLLLVFEGVDQSRPGQVVLAGAAAALLREDIAFFMLILALMFLREARAAMAVLGGVSVVTLLIGRVVAGGRDPALEPPHVNFSYDYIDLADPLGTMAGAADALFAAGGYALVLVIIAIAIPWIGFGRLDWKATAFGAVAAAPFLLSQYAVTKSVSSHYYFALAPILFWAAVRGAREQEAAPNEGIRARLPVVGVALAVLGGPLAIGALASGATTALDVLDITLSDRARIQQTHEALDCLPDRLSLAVGPELTPHVADHSMVWQWPQPVATAVWVLGGNRFVLESVDPSGRPDAIVFARSSYSPTEFGYEAVPTHPDANVQVFLREGLGASELAACLLSNS